MRRAERRERKDLCKRRAVNRRIDAEVSRCDHWLRPGIQSQWQKDSDHESRRLKEAMEQRSAAAKAAARLVWYMLSNDSACQGDGRLALSPLEEREARKIEKKLREITRLEDKLGQGILLDKLQILKIQSKASLESSLVMQKIRAGAFRPSM